MNLDRKGFMMAEVIVVSAISVAIMVSMYASSSKIVKAYELRDSYYNVDAIYATGYIYNHLIDSLDINSYLKELGSSSSLSFIDLSNKNNNYIDNIVLQYDLGTVLLIKNNSIDDICDNSSINKTMKAYLANYVTNNISDISGYSIVTERKKNSNEYYYYFIEL